METPIWFKGDIWEIDWISKVRAECRAGLHRRKRLDQGREDHPELHRHCQQDGVEERVRAVGILYSFLAWVGFKRGRLFVCWVTQVHRKIAHYNLDVIIAIGYRVQSPVATRFRRWATARLHEFIQKGFALDDERLKNGRNRYFKELLQRIRGIRSSERNFYQQVTDIYATSIDYDPRKKITKDFFATVQNKLHYAVHEHTAAELVYERVDSEKPFVGMTN